MPTTESNYFVDFKQIIIENPEYAEKYYEGMLVVREEAKNKLARTLRCSGIYFKGEDVKDIK